MNNEGEMKLEVGGSHSIPGQIWDEVALLILLEFQAIKAETLRVSQMT